MSTFSTLQEDKRNIIVIGASAGGYSAIMELCQSLPSDLQAAVFIVQHIPPYGASQLSELLNKKCPLKVVTARNGMTFEAGHVYCATNNHHLILEEGKIIVSRGPKENRFRPSIDALFRSAAYSYKGRVIGIILSGALNDGVSGMWSIKRLGGLAIVQKPEEAPFDSMPLETIRHVEVDYTLSASEMGQMLGELTQEPATKKYELPVLREEQMGMEVAIAKNENALKIGVLERGEFTPLTCPDCQGALVKIPDEKFLRFRCHTGHAFTADALLAGVTENIERDLWKVMRGMEEGYLVLNRVGEQLEGVGIDDQAKRFYEKAEMIRLKSRYIHQVISEEETLSKQKLEEAG